MRAEADRSSVLREFDVSREIAARLDVYAAELVRWQRIVGLVSAGDLADLWRRHIADSLQLAAFAGRGLWVDLGSGAGFPGLVVAIARPDTPVILVESNARKCAFLRHVSREAAPQAEVRDGRIEDVLPALGGAEIVSARALAGLTQLLAWSAPLLCAGAVGLFPKGKDYAAELTAAQNSWSFAVDVLPSRTDANARILRVHGFSGRRD